MKKNTLLFSLILVIGLGLTAERLFPNILSFSKVSETPRSKPQKLSKRYTDCISETDLFGHSKSIWDIYSPDQEEALAVVIKNLKEYQHTLDSTVKNLNTIDAHEYLHNEYAKNKSLMLASSVSEMQAYYYWKIMESCYVLDKSLNEVPYGVAEIWGK